MNLRISVVILVLTTVLAGYILLVPPFDSANPEEQLIAESRDLEWFFNVEDRKIDFIKVNHFDNEKLFYRDAERKWRVDSLTGTEVGTQFLGTAFLAGGSKSPRMISNIADPDLTQYGLINPKIIVTVHLEPSPAAPDGITYSVEIGDITADGINNYAAIEGNPEVYLLDRTWGEYMASLVTNTPMQ